MADTDAIVTRIDKLSIPEPNSGCWIWLGSVGDTKLAPKHWRATMSVAGKTMTAARVSYAAHRGPIPTGMHVLHRCDNPLCVNPDHLWLGTHADNMRDCTKKNRRIPARRTVGCTVGGKRGGVYPTRGGKFRAQIGRSQKLYYLGTFTTHQAAAEAVAVAVAAAALLKAGG